MGPELVDEVLRGAGRKTYRDIVVEAVEAPSRADDVGHHRSETRSLRCHGHVSGDVANPPPSTQ